MATAAEACTLHWLGPGNAAGDAAFNLSQLFGQHGDRLTVGRTEAAVLVRKPPAGGTASGDLHRHISRRHHAAFTLVRANGGAAATLMVTDPGSTHGTFVGGMRLPANEAQALADGDVVSFGDKPVISVGTAKVCSQSGIQARVIPVCCATALPFTSVRQERSRNARQRAISSLPFKFSINSEAVPHAQGRPSAFAFVIRNIAALSDLAEPSIRSLADTEPVAVAAPGTPSEQACSFRLAEAIAGFVSLYHAKPAGADRARPSHHRVKCLLHSPPLSTMSSPSSLLPATQY